MNTPIADFIMEYAKSETSRLHMPGHKGRGFLGFESLDITEIRGADVLYAAEGIIKESEDNCSLLFDTAHSFYSTEGSSLAIKAMLSLVATASGARRPTVLAARNAHKAFLYAAAWLDLDVKWLFPEDPTHLCACPITKEAVAAAISASPSKPHAVYLTSPDYLGNLADIKGIAEVCAAHSIPLLVDNAHGAYLRFVVPDLHPITLGATICCDSAHKTLPVLTGGAYLHIAKNADPYFVENAREALASFASTSPSYLTLASLDMCNFYLNEEYKKTFATAVKKLNALKNTLSSLGFTLCGNEPLKLTVYAPDCGFSGNALADLLRKYKVECEFSDEEYLVLMFSPQNSELDYLRVMQAFECAAQNHDTFQIPLPRLSFSPPPVAMTVREALLSRSEILPVEKAVGRIMATPTVSCPPAVPITVSGEVITEEAIALFRRYGIKTVAVVK